MDENPSLEEEKARLRKELRQRLNSLGPKERAARSQVILRRLFKHPEFLKARFLVTYMAFAQEVETRPLLEEALREGKKVFVPRVDPEKGKLWIIQVTKETSFQPGAYGILEPPFDRMHLGNTAEMELAVVPGLGFDRGGGRLGRGKGYFDRFLKEAHQAYKIGLAFECQVVEKIPRGPDDAVLDEVLIV